eukprot:TRINITY_DN32576_c0_g1_i1.p2 TRINITY_DN32576_c0_g1~~TRINITY_DN32576_c0_g1_i1.p2  ORF type:complete len:193 (-),score=44.39 TRINITY_DN32576_c0_g1_i1:148-726(-)
MASRRLPMRQVSATTAKVEEMGYSGCTKRPSHRLLPAFQKFEIPYKFPRFPQIFGVRIASRIKRKEQGSVEGHPCLRIYDEFLDCARHHPDTYDKKCKGQAGKCLQCFEEHKDWKPPSGVDYMRFLEHFKIFMEGRQSLAEGVGKFNYRKASPTFSGAGTVMKFGGYPTEAKAGGGSGTGRSGASARGGKDE